MTWTQFIVVYGFFGLLTCVFIAIPFVDYFVYWPWKRKQDEAALARERNAVDYRLDEGRAVSPFLERPGDGEHTEG